MNAERIKHLSNFLDKSRTLLGEITTLKERIAWLEAGEPICVSFPKRVVQEIQVPQEFIDVLRIRLLEMMRHNLAAKHQEFAELEPNTIVLKEEPHGA